MLVEGPPPLLIRKASETGSEGLTREQCFRKDESEAAQGK